MKTQLLILLVLTSVILSQNFLEDHQRGGLHDYIWRLPREKLTSWALATEAYHRKVNNQQGLLGGLDDYIHNLTNQEIVSYILKQIDEHPELNNQEKLDAITIEFSTAPKVEKGQIIGGDGGLHDYIWKLERPVLNRWALATEKYHRKVNNQRLFGGLHDYIDTLNNSEVIDYIMREVKEHPEIANANKLDSLVIEFGITNQTSHNVTVANPIGGDGGLHDYIWRMERSTLNKWALTTEKYHRQVNNQKLYGGLHDYIDTLSNQEVIQYIMKEVSEHPELGVHGKLDTLATQFGITGETHKVASIIGGDGGLHDFIWTLPREKLESWALSTEKYHNKEKFLIGGLHDYIKSLSNQQVIDYIMKEVKEHPEIASKDKLDSLSLQYGFSSNSTQPSVNSTNNLIGGGLHDVVAALDRKSLIAYALAMDEYSHEKSPRLGGIHDYVYTLKDSEIRNFILRTAETHPELNSRNAVEGLIKKYNISVKDS